MLAFGVAILLYLIVEELLIEAHKQALDSELSTSLYFLGFFALYAFHLISFG